MSRSRRHGVGGQQADHSDHHAFPAAVQGDHNAGPGTAAPGPVMVGPTNTPTTADQATRCLIVTGGRG